MFKQMVFCYLCWSKLTATQQKLSVLVKAHSNSAKIMWLENNFS